MGSGTYTDKNGNRVKVTQTKSGYLIKYLNSGHTVSIKA